MMNSNHQWGEIWGDTSVVHRTGQNRQKQEQRKQTQMQAKFINKI